MNAINIIIIIIRNAFGMTKCIEYSTKCISCAEGMTMNGICNSCVCLVSNFVNYPEIVSEVAGMGVHLISELENGPSSVEFQ